MLHDLFMLSEFFDPPFSMMREQELMDMYGPQAVCTALSMGLIECRCAPCMGGAVQNNFYVLSQAGLNAVMQKAVAHAA